MIEYHDPQASVDVENIPYRLGIKLRGSNKANIALLANGYPDSENFLNHIADALQKLEPGITLHRFNKGNASVPVSEEMLGQITDQCQALITAYGH